MSGRGAGKHIMWSVVGKHIMWSFTIILIRRGHFTPNRIHFTECSTITVTSTDYVSDYTKCSCVHVLAPSHTHTHTHNIGTSASNYSRSSHVILSPPDAADADLVFIGPDNISQITFIQFPPCRLLINSVCKHTSRWSLLWWRLTRLVLWPTMRSQYCLSTPFCTRKLTWWES